MKDWFVTLKWNNTEYAVAEDYMDPIADMLRIAKQSVIVYNCFEYDSQGKVHFHCHLKTRYVHWKTFTDKYKDTGLHVNNVELITIDDVRRVHSYMKKHSLNADKILYDKTMEFYHNEPYAFI